MMKRFFVILTLLSICGFVFPLSAQEATAEPTPTIKVPACDLASLQNTINLFIGALGKLRNSNETDPVKIADQIQAFANAANNLRATCDGLAFEGSASKVIGPITFPAGVYRAIATSAENSMTVTINTVEGECGAGAFSVYGYQLLFSAGGELVFGSDGCVALLEVQTFGNAWTLSFERLTN